MTRPTTPAYDDDVRLAHVLADTVEPITMERFRAADLAVSTKPDLTPVSEADLEAERVIRAQLSRARPRDSIKGEEFGVTGTGERQWILDPIDGTKNYVRGVPVWATLIGLVDAGEPVVGLVSAPALGRRWWAGKGTGAWSGRSLTSASPISVSGVSTLSDASLSYASLSGWRAAERLDSLLDLLDDCWRTRAYGDFWSYMLVAEGAVDIAAEPKLADYDMAALVPIVTEAGGRFTGLDGRDGCWSGNAVATNGLLHDEVLSRLGRPLISISKDSGGTLREEAQHRAHSPASGDTMTITETAVTEGSVVQRRELRTELPGPKSRALAERRDKVVAAGVASTMPMYVARAAGGILEDVDGNRLIDLGSGIAVTSVGNSDPRVVAGVQQQVADFTHTCFMVSPYEGYVAVAEKLAELTPGDHAKKSALFNSGAEAVENAVKVARYATGRSAVVAVDHAYHGRTNLTMALTAKAMPYKTGFGPFASDIYRVPTSYPFRDPEGMTGEQAAQRAISIAEKTIGADQIAAVIIEPVQGEGGFIVPAPGFLPAMSKWCTENGIVFIADEVQSGFSRTGAWFACDHEGVVPDLVTTAKGIAGGLPLAALTGRAELLDAVHGGGLGGTYGGNPVACAAALGAIETMQAEDLPGRARHIEEIVKGRLNALTQTHPEIGEVRGRGAMIALEIVKPGSTEPDPTLTAAIAKKCHAQGVIILTCGTYGNVIRLLPPLVISDELLNEGLDVLIAAFDS